MTSKSYSTILYDWDGCLADTLPLIFEAYHKTFAEFNISLTNQEITSKVMGDWNGPKNVGVTDIVTFNDSLLEKILKKYAKVPLHQGMPAVLHQLRDKGKQLAVVTTSTNQMIDDAIANNDLETLFEVVVTAETVKEHKPNPEPIFYAVDQLGANLDTTIIIGDSKSDLGAAANAGIDSVLFFPNTHASFHQKEKLVEEYKPTFVIEKHSQLLDIIL